MDPFDELELRVLESGGCIECAIEMRCFAEDCVALGIVAAEDLIYYEIDVIY